MLVVEACIAVLTFVASAVAVRAAKRARRSEDVARRVSVATAEAWARIADHEGHSEK